MPTHERTLLGELDHLEFSRRVNELHQAGRLDHESVQRLMDMAETSTSVRQFRERFEQEGKSWMGGTEFRYLTTTLDTPEGRRPETWLEAAAHVRAFGASPHETTARVQRMEEDREQFASRQYAM